MNNIVELIDTEKLHLMIVENLTNQWLNIISVLPNIVGSIIILLIGWLCAWSIRKITLTMLKKIGLDHMSSNAGVLSVMDSAGIKQQPSDIAGKVLFWLVLFMFMIPAADTLGFNDLVLLIKSVVGFLPKLLIAIVTLVLGTMFAKFIKDTINNSSIFENVNSSKTIANAIYAVIVASIVLMALEQLSFNTKLLHTIMMLLIGAILFAIAMAVGFGARDVAKNILFGNYARESFSVGTVIELKSEQENVKGRVVEISTLSTFIELPTGERVSIPNADLYRFHVKIVMAKEA
ncbi:MAG: mechanosensitive ion channel [Oceanospirillaceae bacterium]|nr:mechanosensitive ion channel [Oceanospirillaceae bacterium]